MTLPRELEPREEGEFDIALDDIARAMPDIAPEVPGLRAGGWEYAEAFAQDGGMIDADDNRFLDIALCFREEFGSGREMNASADARACGVTESSSAVSSWEAGSRRGDPGLWELSD